MDRNQIHDLLELLPPNISLDGELVDTRWAATSGEGISGADLIKLADQENERYALAYSDLQFGWRWLQLVITNELEFTDAMRHVADPVIHRAYSHITKQHYDPYVMEAMQIARSSVREPARRILNALFLATDYTLEAVCGYTQLDPISVAVYEKLFFSAVDRRLDSLWLASTVYPKTLAEELSDNYMSAETSDFSQLLIRAGLKNGMRDVLYFAGHPAGAGLLADAQARETPERMESLIMANGYLMARNGWLGQRSNAAGFNNARGLISAAKIGGQGIGGAASSPFESMGTTLSQALIQAKRHETTMMLQQRTEYRTSGKASAAALSA
jgi:hypothetical protein